MGKISVVLVDDHTLVRRGIKDAISSNGNIEVIDEASSGEEALDKLSSKQPDVLITDISMTGITGLDLCEKVQEKYPSINVLFLTMHKDPVYVVKAFEVGAFGYLPKDIIDSELQEAIIQIGNGDKHMNDFVSKILADQFVKSKTQSDIAPLTGRELEVLKGIVNGKTNKQIGADLYISERTIDTHRTNVMRKLSAKNTADIVRIALTKNLLE